MLNDFISELKTCPYYDCIFNGHDVIMIYVAGSRLYGVTDSLSDYDLIVVVNEKKYTERNMYLTYEGKKVHWYYIPLKMILSMEMEQASALNFFGNTIFGFIDDDKVVYENPNYKNTISALKSEKYNIGLMGVATFYNSQTKHVEAVLSAGTVEKEQCSKLLSHLCVASYFVLGEEIGKDFITSVKRIRWQPVCDEYKQKIVERFRLLKEYLDKHPVDITSTSETIYAKIISNSEIQREE